MGFKLNEFWAALAGAVVGSLVSGAMSDDRHRRFAHWRDKRRAKAGHSRIDRHHHAGMLRPLDARRVDVAGPKVPSPNTVISCIKLGSVVQLGGWKPIHLSSTGLPYFARR